MRMKWLLLSVLLMLAPVARAEVEAPQTVSEYPDVPRSHWVYVALKKWTTIRVNNRPLVEHEDGDPFDKGRSTRYEFAVAVARLLERLPSSTQVTTTTFVDLNDLQKLPTGTITSDDPNFTLPMLADIIASLRREFAPELQRLGVRGFGFEPRVPLTPRKSVTPTFLHTPSNGSFLLAPPKKDPNYVSPTFADILRRVARRDEATGAIISVKRTASALPPLKFSMTQSDQGDHVLIRLSEKTDVGDKTYEQSILNLNNAMRAELRLQKLLQESQKAK